MRQNGIFRYEPALDGLRAVAVTMVVLYHASPRLFPGGWMGVDVFFVLSGYLITSLLVRELEITSDIDFKKFYIKRLLRLTPALWSLIIVMFAIVEMFKPNFVNVGQNSLISVSYLMNWSRAFGLLPAGHLDHTWSLAMEEQFYLVWPFLLLLFYHRRPLRWLVAIIMSITLWRIYLADTGVNPERTYNGFDTHGDGLYIGCALVFAPISSQWLIRARSLALIPIVATITMFVWVPLQSLFTQTIGLTLSSIISAWLIIAILQNGWLRRALSSKPLVYTGKISYGLYLWHYAVLFIAREITGLDVFVWKLLMVLSTYPVAMFSHRFIEKPFLRIKNKFEVRA